MYSEDELNLFFQEDCFTPQQWQTLNDGLNRQISIDINGPTFEDPFMPTQIEESASQSSSLGSFHTEPETTPACVSSVPERIRTKKEKDSNYEKNICAYITKKAVQCLLDSNYRKAVQKLCLKYRCDFSKLQTYYGQRYKEVFGITHLTLLITPDKEEQVSMKKVFRVFLKWFLREKYMFYLLKYGKMSDKEKYVLFKNKYLLFIDEQTVSHNVY